MNMAGVLIYGGQLGLIVILILADLALELHFNQMANLLMQNFTLTTLG